MTGQKSVVIEFKTIEEAVAHLDAAGSNAAADVGNYRRQVEELTGHNPNNVVTAIDVVKIVLKAFPQLGAAK